MKTLIITQQHPQNHQKKIDKCNNIFYQEIIYMS